MKIKRTASIELDDMVQAVKHQLGIPPGVQIEYEVCKTDTTYRIDIIWNEHVDSQFGNSSGLKRSSSSTGTGPWDR